MNDISQNIKKVLVVFLICFMGVMSYIAYFQVLKADKIVESPYNKRLQAKRNAILRGTIYDRNMKALTKSKKISTLNQERSYVAGEVFAHALGYINPKYGMTGIEKQYDSILIGSDTMDIGKFLNSITEKEEKVGYNLRTSLDYNIQMKAFEILGNNKGSVVVLNPQSGEILAMVSKPSFDPNNLEKNWKNINNDKDIPLYNRAILGLYPPGSTFKIVTAVSALENIKGVTTRIFDDEGVLVFNQKEALKNFNGTVYGNIDLKKAFYKSSNVVFGTLGMELGNEALKGTAEKFYFNKELESTDFTSKVSRFPTLNKNEKGNMAQCGIGQGEVLASPLEMAMVAAAIANDGHMMKPYLVKDVLNEKGDSIKKIKTQELSQVTSSENAKLIKEYMALTVSEGTGGNAALDSVSVCGKTGTADTGRASEAPHSWFVGFAPKENPQIAIAVIVENGGVGGGTAAEISREVIREALKK
ncbi:penicillin-binding protein A [Clostridium homopropionicum DSM 5847]|uniref:Penicillin-binding protein A n=1 Tax=Clostridium homopropionicum DSM 5847 TaxID=1121318 RepID=A0A0L6Z9F6_9CLOT|nr:penicillin-binding transpeptidase domain-containing protein [Clostridium homopropionicum]KOA19606.1 penicillin-binding protein A [Clostridium homopropionicum DSM 5847]SFF81909.1 Cell division protein FtsI/penicillin-binding protein 2 [Clostridium homopropionicum]